MQTSCTCTPAIVFIFGQKHKTQQQMHAPVNSSALHINLVKTTRRYDMNAHHTCKQFIYIVIVHLTKNTCMHAYMHAC